MIEKIIRFVLTFIHIFKNVSLVIEYEERLSSLKAMKKTQCTNGTWDYDHYMHGYANGMILAIATLENKSPTFLNAPKEFLRNSNTHKEQKPKHSISCDCVDCICENAGTIIPFPKQD